MVLRRSTYVLAVMLSVGALPAQQRRRAPARKAPASAKPAAPAQTRFPLETLKVEGNHEIPVERILAAAGLKSGSKVDKAVFEAARKKLLDTGAFENVGYEYKPSADGAGYDATIQVQEVIPLFPYRVEDLPAPEAVLLAALRKQEPVFGDRIPDTDAVVSRYVKTLEQAIRENGGGNVEVVGKLLSDSPTNPAIVFRPSTARPNIAEVRFQGNDAVPSALLLRTFSEVAIGIPYTETAVRQRLDASIRPLYEARGRIRVSFPKIATQKAEGVDGVVVTVTVDEGPSYKLGSVRITGVPPSQIAQFLKIADFKRNNIANFNDIQAGVGRVTKRIRDNGFLHVTSKVNRDIHDATHTVDLTVAMEPGAQYRFGKLDIEGLDILTEPAIRKAWGNLEGKPFQPDYPDAFLARLRAEQVFENLGKTRSETHINEASRTVDVTLYFTGASGNSSTDAAGAGPGVQQ
jgi:outer membrane protein insertion porin family